MKYILATQETMVNTFWECNEKCFDNSLPTPWFETVNSVRILGKFEYHKTKKNSKKPIVDQTIKMSDCFYYPEKDFIETMVHEMIHYYIAWNRIKDNRSHGREFMKIAKELREKFGFEITETRNTSSFKLTENAPKLVERKKTSFFVFLRHLVNNSQRKSHPKERVSPTQTAPSPAQKSHSYRPTPCRSC